MAVSSDIVATWRGPGRVVRRLLARGENEARALAFLMAGCALTFVSRWPALAREAHLEKTELAPAMGAALFAWMFVAPLLFYVLAALSHLVTRAMGGQGTGHGARLALFWAFLAASPLMLLNGLVEGFIGQGPGLQMVGLAWLLAFAWFWIAGLRVTAWPGEVAA